MKDLIERQDAIDALMAWEEVSIWDEECLKHRGEPFWESPSDVIEKLPSAQPKILACGEGELNVPDTNVGDMISRQTVLRCLIDISYNQCKTQGEADVIDTAKTMVIVMPSTQPEPKWIPCSERLPEPRMDVWACSDIGQIQGYYEEHVGIWYASFGQGRDYLELYVTAWMPLPEPYQAERREK